MTGAITQGFKQRRQGRYGGAFAVGAGHGNDFFARLRPAHALPDDIATIQAKINRRMVPALQSCQPLVEMARLIQDVTTSPLTALGREPPLSKASKEAILSRNWRRSTIMSIAPFSSRNSLR